MITADPEYYKNLQKELTKNGWRFTIASSVFGICIASAFYAGVNAGWPWLLGALVALLVALLARIDEQHTRVLIQIYLANAK